MPYLVCLAQSLQALQQIRVRNVSQVEQAGDRCAERLQLAQFMIRFGQLRSQACDIFTKTLRTTNTQIRVAIQSLRALHLTRIHGKLTWMTCSSRRVLSSELSTADRHRIL